MTQQAHTLNPPASTAEADWRTEDDCETDPEDYSDNELVEIGGLDFPPQLRFRFRIPVVWNTMYAKK